jgi:hypothetical protein
MDERPGRPAPTRPVRRRRAFDPGRTATGEDEPPLPPVVQVGSRDRGPAVLAIAILAFVGIAIVKPWPASAPSSIAITPPHLSETDPPTPAPTPDPLAGLRRQCEEPLGWRVYTVEDWYKQTLRIWRSVAPAAAATGPLDPSIPVVPLGPVVGELGYCSPWDGAERPPPGSTLTAWSVPAPGVAGRAVRLTPASTAAYPPSVLGAAFGPPGPSGPPSSHADDENAGGSPATGASPSTPGVATVRRWPAGRFVFELTGQHWSRWWSVEIAAGS